MYLKYSFLNLFIYLLDYVFLLVLTQTATLVKPENDCPPVGGHSSSCY